MNATDHFHSVLTTAAHRFAASLSHFQAWNKAEGITERNLSFQAAVAFLGAEPHGFAFLEVPFSSPDRSRADNHLDAYLFSRRIGYLLECKQLYSAEKLASLAQDIRRLDSSLYLALAKRHTGIPPEQVHPVVLADTWQPHVARWWVNDPNHGWRWSREHLPSTWSYGSLTVFKISNERDGTLYWLYAIGPALSIAGTPHGRLEATLVPDELAQLAKETIEELLQNLPVSERLKGIPAEKLLKGLSLQERVKGLSADDLLAALPAETRAALAKRLRDDNSLRNPGDK